MFVFSLVISSLLMGIVFFLAFPSLIWKTRKREKELDEKAGFQREVYLDKRLLWFFRFGTFLTTVVGFFVALYPSVLYTIQLTPFPTTLILWVVSLFDISICFLASTHIFFDDSKMVVKSVFGKEKTIPFEEIVSISGKANKKISTNTGAVIVFCAFSGKEDLLKKIHEWKCQNQKKRPI